MKKIYLIISMIVLLFIIGCSNPTITSENSNNNNDKQTTALQESNVDYKLTRLLAENQILAIKQFDNNWDGAVISDYFLWYNPIVTDRPAYIEYKLTKNNQDAGYIIVSTTEKDFDIPEYHTSGKAMYEIMQEQAGTKDIKGTRFNAFNFMVEYTKNNTPNKLFMGSLSDLNDIDTNTVANRSIVNSEYENYLNSYISKRYSIGDTIGGTKKELSQYHQIKEENKQRNIIESAKHRGNPTPPYQKYINAQVHNAWNIPFYQQYGVSGKFYNSGCSATAGAMVLAYWYLQHGRTKLFSSRPPIYWENNNNDVRGVIETLRSPAYMHTDYNGNTWIYEWYNDVFGYRGAYYGLYQYVYNKGYNYSIWRYYNVDNNDYDPSTEAGCSSIINEWKTIFDHIANDRPPILFYNDNENGFGGHAAVIYTCTLERNEWTSDVNTAHCTIKTGWAGDRANQPREKTINSTSYFFHDVIVIEVHNY